jgi:DHA1 family multidrug resistance protein-like MFS transporter
MIGLCSASEIPAIGRCKPYIITLFLFVILQIPTALVDNIAGFMILRFLAGLVGSPPLATGGASVGDVFAPEYAPMALGLWGLSASAGPVLGPLIGGYATEGFNNDWRWTIWPLLMLSGFTFIVLSLSMPESSASNILHRRAERLRQVSGNPHLRSKGEIFAATLTGNEIAMMTFVRPFRLGLFEPIALSINLHIGMVYGVLYVVS